MSDLREPHERPDTCSAAELADILDRFIALPSTEAIFKAAAKKLRALSAEPAQPNTPHDAGSHNQRMTPALQRVIDAADKRERDRTAMPPACPTPTGCRENGCHGECIPAEPAQEMTDERIDIEFHNYGVATIEARRKVARAIIAADRASRLPEMREGDWPELPPPTFPADERSPDLWDVGVLRHIQRTAVEAYKALVRGKT